MFKISAFVSNMVRSLQILVAKHFNERERERER